MTLASPSLPDRQTRPRGTPWAVAFGFGTALLAMSGSALAAERWEEAGSGAVAILPVPSKATVVTGGSLVCAEQRWSLRLRTEPRREPLPTVHAKVDIDGSSYLVEAEQEARSATLPVSYEMIDGLKGGGRLSIELGAGNVGPTASFPLRDSRKVIEAITPLCSQVDMFAYEKIEVSEADPAVETARPLLDEEIKLFRAATTATPGIAAVRLDRGEGREMLFSTLCGSSWYYGRSGCSLFGFSREAGADWRQVYNSEGMALYLDPNASNGGWPNLVTLEAAGGVEPMHWKWNGSGYGPRDPEVAIEETPQTGTVEAQ